MDNVVKSAARVFEVLEYFAERQSAASADEVRQALGYPQSSTSVLLRSLASLGYLTYDAYNRRFRPTIRIALLGAWLVEETDGGRNPTQAMRSLSAATGDMIILGAMHKLEAVYAKVLPATNPVRFHMKQGARRPICTTAIGRSLLSSKTDREIRAIVRRLNAEREEGSPLLSEAQVLDGVNEGRRLGYFVTKGSATPGAGVVAVPIGTLVDEPPFAIGIGAPIDRIENDCERFVELLKKAVS
ncbi:IclR family transcriptional regulator [Rhizorhabdus dicambivorans]|uniref:Transcriptional regulator, IclR family protein n=1 Tax=Rhizorhabdus dicambivorans TaxID=1850238 RepID=A0A2A4FQB2_9SPHN|nr:IclR family transcriptional regulator C-terminal domain-containing protein [Rhizorhabdus dicambivorans]ATE66391.1 transcriptional regulator, IclR family protein [Rhizorhabdus dicambivorans]PCE40367.1 transcriptional regulator, IclR family protein [Rhizorhabdus dicambivorans]